VREFLRQKAIKTEEPRTKQALKAAPCTQETLVSNITNRIREANEGLK
jgi:hypothetical protein